MQVYMQKFLKIGEQHVQWFALGLGVFYLLFMGWSYVYKSDISVSLGPKVGIEPGEIDQSIVKGPITELQTQINSPDPITITAPNVVAGWNDGVTEVAVNYEPLPAFTHSDPFGDSGGSARGPIDQHNAALISKLPVIPPATPVAVASYRTLVQVPDPAFVAPAGGDPNAKAPLINQDLDAASVLFKIDMKALAAAFTSAFTANAQPEAFQTMYLKVSLLRQEQVGTGWGPLIEVPPLTINTPSVYPGETPGQQDGFLFEMWAGANQELICRPPFYPTAPGAQAWTPPVPPAPATDAAAPAGAPGAPGAAAVGAGPAQPGAARAFPQPPPPPPVFDQPPPIPQQAAGAWQGQVFDPRTKGADEILIAHDATVVPEKTYRYFVQYRLLNPLFGAHNLAANPDLTKQFALVSPGPDVSPPSDKLTIPSRTQLFVKQVHNATEAHFTVFVFAPSPKETEVVASPGDSIAPTHWTLVDIRKNENPTAQSDYQLVLVDEEGNTQLRDLHNDQADPAQKDLHDKANAANPPGGPAALNQ